MYLSYFKYMIKHKWLVALECFKMGLYWQGITHDLSKFLPSEAIPYAKFYNSNKRNKTEEDSIEFHYAWNLHQKRNKHHWNYWISILDGEIKPLPMPEKYVRELVCDWAVLGKIFGLPPKAYYEKNKHKIMFHEETEKLFLKYVGE